MISSTSSTDRSARSELANLAGQSDGRAKAPRPDYVSTESARLLRAELARQPEVRPEALARARELAADPNYPSLEVLRDVASQILNSPDLSEDES